MNRLQSQAKLLIDQDSSNTVNQGINVKKLENVDVYEEFLEKQGFGYKFLSSYQYQKGRGFFKKTLVEQSKIFEKLDVYINKNCISQLFQGKHPNEMDLKDFQMAVVFKAASDDAAGHIGLFHGGLTMTIVDEYLGFLNYIYSDGVNFATKDLKFEFIKPLEIDKTHLLLINMVRVQDRSMYSEAVIYNEKFKTKLKILSEFKFIKSDNKDFQVKNLQSFPAKIRSNEELSKKIKQIIEEDQQKQQPVYKNNEDIN